MQDPRQPMFLARQSYRNRRLGDAARIVPVAALLVFMLPLMWTGREGASGNTGWAGLWLFWGWFALIVVTALLSKRLRRLDQHLDRPPVPDEDSTGQRAGNGSL